jgi:Spy/CpxP family protein refolding chaperone
MKAATANGAFDEAAVSQIAAEQGQLSAQLIVEKERVKSQIFAILTNEQKAKAVELEKEFDGKMKRGHRGKRGDFVGPEVSQE